ncbi:sortase domain-bontaining protein [Microbacterium sp. NPDC089698]|uniref:sortase domain-containing protein n=1 Tax=Microbacterium sp. NPDC089698 TaxID=3364200 RepID=UPI00381C52D1
MKRSGSTIMTPATESTARTSARRRRRVFGHRLSVPVMRPAPPPRDGRWWAGAAILTVSVLLLSLVVHATVFSALQHYRAQTLSYNALRVSLAKAETPVGQLVDADRMAEIGTPVAYLEIPAIGLKEVVVEGTGAEVLRDGPGHRRDSVMPGQSGTAVVLGRQSTYGGPFSQLNRLKPGDEIRVTTGQGTNEFTVFGLRRAGDPMPAPLSGTQGRLELQTADGLALFPSGVLHVDAQLTSTARQTPSRVMAYPALPIGERGMGQDSPGWFLAFFALVFLAVAGIAVWWLWRSWGRWQAWVIGVPVLVAFGVATADAVMNALPNLL